MGHVISGSWNMELMIFLLPTRTHSHTLAGHHPPLTLLTSIQKTPLSREKCFSHPNPSTNTTTPVHYKYPLPYTLSSRFLLRFLQPSTLSSLRLPSKHIFPLPSRQRPFFFTIFFTHSLTHSRLPRVLDPSTKSGVRFHLKRIQGWPYSLLSLSLSLGIYLQKKSKSLLVVTHKHLGFFLHHQHQKFSNVSIPPAYTSTCPLFPHTL